MSRITRRILLPAAIAGSLAVGGLGWGGVASAATGVPLEPASSVVGVPQAKPVQCWNSTPGGFLPCVFESLSASASGGAGQ